MFIYKPTVVFQRTKLCQKRPSPPNPARALDNLVVELVGRVWLPPLTGTRLSFRLLRTNTGQHVVTLRQQESM